jgi:predicted ATPase
MRKFIIGGGPHTGKTTLSEALQQEMPADTHFIPEPAAILIQSELAEKDRDPSHQIILPTTDYPTFVSRAIAKSIELENNIPPGTSTAILDRSLIDNVGYARYFGHDECVPHIQEHAQTAGYTAIFLCDFVGTYDQTRFRMGDEKYAHRVHDLLTAAYEESGLPVVNMPPLSVPERVSLAVETMESFGL